MLLQLVNIRSSAVMGAEMEFSEISQTCRLTEISLSKFMRLLLEKNCLSAFKTSHKMTSLEH